MDLKLDQLSLTMEAVVTALDDRPLIDFCRSPEAVVALRSGSGPLVDLLTNTPEANRKAVAKPSDEVGQVSCSRACWLWPQVVSAGFDAQAHHDDPGEWPLGLPRATWLGSPHPQQCECQGGISPEPFCAHGPQRLTGSRNARGTQSSSGCAAASLQRLQRGAQGAFPLGPSQVHPVLWPNRGEPAAGSPGFREPVLRGLWGGKGVADAPFTCVAFLLQLIDLASPLILLSTEADKENMESPLLKF